MPLDQKIDADSDISSDEEDENAEALKAKMTALEEQKRAAADEKAAAAEDAAKIEKEKNQKKSLRKWAPILLLGPFVPAIFSIIYIVWGAIALNRSQEAIEKVACGFPLETFISVNIGLAYTFLFFYSWVFVGPKPIKSLRSLTIVYAVIYFFWFIWHAIGTMWWNSAGGDKGCMSKAIHMYRFSSFCVLAFWGTTIVFAIYVFEMHYFAQKKKMKEANEQRMADLERKIQQEETGFKGKTPDMDDEDAEEAAHEAAEREAFYDSPSDSDSD